MSHKICDCESVAVITTIPGERCHITNERGEWCAVINDNKIYLQNLLIPSQMELDKEIENENRIAIELAAELAKEAKKNEIKTKLANGEQLTQQELSELLLLII